MEQEQHTVSERQARTDRARGTAESARGGRSRWHVRDVPSVELDDNYAGVVATWDVRFIDAAAVNS